MKNLFQVLIALFIASVLTACGGEQKSTSASNSASGASDSVELIIDNGRGTVNGTDTERPR
jgi:ABC-type Fe3+-hydroxamate transport system substrate-binding protein